MKNCNNIACGYPNVLPHKPKSMIHLKKLSFMLINKSFISNISFGWINYFCCNLSVFTFSNSKVFKS